MPNEMTVKCRGCQMMVGQTPDGNIAAEVCSECGGTYFELVVMPSGITHKQAVRRMRWVLSRIAMNKDEPKASDMAVEVLGEIERGLGSSETKQPQEA